MPYIVASAASLVRASANLQCRSKVLSDKCALLQCNARGATHYVLSSCTVAATPHKRYDLRHNSVRLHIMKRVIAVGTDRHVIADMDDCRLSYGGTIPPEIVVTGRKPVIDRTTNAM